MSPDFGKGVNEEVTRRGWESAAFVEAAPFGASLSLLRLFGDLRLEEEGEQERLQERLRLSLIHI